MLYMKKDFTPCLKIFIALFICFISGYQVNAQKSSSEPEAYFRYFKLETGHLTSVQLSNLENSFDNHREIKMKSSCIDGKSVLLAVNASYPKRIEAIREEIMSICSAHFSRADIRSVISVALPDITNFCN